MDKFVWFEDDENTRGIGARLQAQRLVSGFDRDLFNPDRDEVVSHTHTYKPDGTEVVIIIFRPRKSWLKSIFLG